MHIGKNIAKIRELLGVKQESLAVTLKISQQTISKIEQTATLRENIVERVANALGVSSSMIFKYTDELLIDFLKAAISETILPKQENISLPLLEKIIELYERLLLVEQEKAQLKK